MDNPRKQKRLSVEEVEKMKALLANGMTPHAVGKELGRDPKTIRRYAEKTEIAQEIKVIQGELADQYEDMAHRMLTSITDEDIEKLSAYQRMVSSGIAIDKARLLKDLSTQNVGVKGAIELIDEAIRAKSGATPPLPGKESKKLPMKTKLAEIEGE
jgi:hypothetical protein